MKISLERCINQEGGKKSCLPGQKTRLKLNSFVSRLQMIWKVPPTTDSQDNQVVPCSKFPEAHWLFKYICLSTTSGLACHKEVRYGVWCAHTAFGVDYTPAFKHWALLSRKSLFKAIDRGIWWHLPVIWVLWRTGSQNQCSLVMGQMQHCQQIQMVFSPQYGRCNCSRPSASASNTG